MKIGIAKEVVDGERRVALTPDAVRRLVNEGHDLLLEAGAGKGSHFLDAAYKEAGAQIVKSADALWGESDILVKVRPPAKREGSHESDLLHEGELLVAFLEPLGNPKGILRLADNGVTAFALEMIPRIGRAQSMDALSSQASVAGYQATLMAAAASAKFFPMLTTAAGTMRPSKVLVIGAGVAGLQAIATARRLGGVVEAFDIRPAVKEEVESLGAKFLQVELEEETEAEGGYAAEVSERAQQAEQAMLAERVAAADVVITTALVPGKRAPLLVTKAMAEAMQPGSVVVDLAAEQGGNCELTKPGKDVVRRGVTVLGPLNLPSTMPIHASQMYARNVSSLLEYLLREGELHLDFEDEIVDGSCVTHGGKVRHERIREAIAQAN